MGTSLDAFHSRLSKGIINMKHISKLSQTTALIAALGAASLSAQAADGGTLTLKASVSKATCALVVGDTATSSNQTSYKALNLGNIASDNKSATKAAYETFGTKKFVVFSLKDPVNPSQPCNLSGTTKFTLNGEVATGTAVVFGKSSFLKNKILASQGGTDALVKILFGGVSGGADPTVPLKDGINELGTFSTTDNGKAFLYAQFAYSAPRDATPGKFSYDMPITVTYK